MEPTNRSHPITKLKTSDDRTENKAQMTRKWCERDTVQILRGARHLCIWEHTLCWWNWKWVMRELKTRRKWRANARRETLVQPSQQIVLTQLKMTLTTEEDWWLKWTSGANDVQMLCKCFGWFAWCTCATETRTWHSWHSYECVMSHRACMEICHASKWVMCAIWKHAKVSCHATHGTHVNAPCHSWYTYECVMSQIAYM